ncbi:MAG: sigma-70 family RNA polymerase sigma factor [Actinobacteria bacterium]|nr:sigma-70 family RNA polymerase sigma factor [Actinomycetota bacterium]
MPMPSRWAISCSVADRPREFCNSAMACSICRERARTDRGTQSRARRLSRIAPRIRGTAYDSNFMSGRGTYRSMACTNPDTAFESGELRRTMRDAIRKLPDNERTTLLLYYEENFTFTQIAEVLDVSESRVSQIHAKAVLTLRATLSAAQFN